MSEEIDELLRTTMGLMPEDASRIRQLANHARNLEAEVARLTKRLEIAETAIGLCSGSCTWYMGAIYEEGVYQGDGPPIALAEAQKLRERVEALETLCLRAAGYIGVRQGPEVDREADELMKMLRGEIT